MCILWSEATVLGTQYASDVIGVMRSVPDQPFVNLISTKYVCERERLELLVLNYL